MIENAEAIHIKANICSPIRAPKFISPTPVATFRKITNMTVASTVAIVVARALINVNMAIGMLAQRE